MPKEYLTYLIPALALIFIIRRTLRTRRIQVEKMWVMPVLLIVVAAMAIYHNTPTDPIGIAGLVIATLAGAAVGWQRGRLTHITLEPGTGYLMSKGSVWGLALVLALYVARQAVQVWARSQPAHGATAVVAADAALLFGFATLTVARLEMFLRCRKLMAEGLTSA